jgi:hypothetical protein
MHSSNVHIIATAVVLGAVAALREGFVATNMAPLASLAAEPGLGVALARGTTARTSHLASIDRVKE